MGDPTTHASGHRARLRKRLFEGGPKALLDHELIEYLLALAIPRRDTKAQAKKLIAEFGGVGPLLSADAKFRQPGLYVYLNHNLIEATMLGAAAHVQVEGTWNDTLMMQMRPPGPILA